MENWNWWIEGEPVTPGDLPIDIYHCLRHALDDGTAPTRLTAESALCDALFPAEVPA